MWYCNVQVYIMGLITSRWAVEVLMGQWVAPVCECNTVALISVQFHFP